MYDRTELHPDGEEAIKSIVEKTPVQLPADYYEFLSCISGAGNPGGMEFEIEVEEEEAGGLSISVCLWPADTLTDFLVHGTGIDVIAAL